MIMGEPTLPAIATAVMGIVRTIISEIRPQLVDSALSGKHGETDNARHEDNFLSVFDMRLHRRYRDLLQREIPEFIYASEEGDPEVIGENPDPDLLVLVDPLDTSELAVRAINGYTHVMVYSRALARPVVAVVGDLFHHVQLYAGARDADGTDRAYVATADGALRPIEVHRSPDMSRALVTNYLMRPTERLLPLAQQRDLIESLAAPSSNGKSWGRIGVDFGSVSLCHVAAGFTDATIEFAKGFAAWDLYPGHYILNAARGTVIDLDGNTIPLDYSLDSPQAISNAMSRRQPFIAASTPQLADALLNSLRL